MSFKTSISCFEVFKKIFLAHKVCLLLYIDFLWFLVSQNFDLGSTVYISSQAFMQELIHSMIWSRFHVKDRSLLFSEKLQ